MEQEKKYKVRWKFVLLFMFTSIFIFCNGDYAYADVLKASTWSGTLGDDDGFQWTYDTATKTITVTGEDSGLDGGYYMSDFELIEREYNIEIKKIIFNDCVFLGKLSCVFTNCWDLECIEFIKCDTSNVTSMEALFNDCSQLIELDLEYQERW